MLLAIQSIPPEPGGSPGRSALHAKAKHTFGSSPKLDGKKFQLFTEVVGWPCSMRQIDFRTRDRCRQRRLLKKGCNALYIRLEKEENTAFRSRGVSCYAPSCFTDFLCIVRSSRRQTAIDSERCGFFPIMYRCVHHVSINVGYSVSETANTLGNISSRVHRGNVPFHA